jgi:hypothetical protein
MVDHLAWAQGYRSRAAMCLLSAKNSASNEFSKCYRQLAEHYGDLARLEEEFQASQDARLWEKNVPAIAY